MRQHAGSRALRFVFAVLGRVQRHRVRACHGACWGVFLQRQHNDPLAQAVLQGQRQRFALKTLQHHQQVRAGRKQPIGRIT